jgi:hypothetical protein
MWLLNAETIKLEYFDDCDSARPYAILSHVWGKNEQTFQNIQALPRFPDSDQPDFLGLSPKIANCCRVAMTLGYQRVWVDTCCIDKSSSAELSEAINSMFQWYQHSSVCIAYLTDVTRTKNRDVEIRHLLSSKWFERGWTLQELIAPHSVVFLAQDWAWLGTKASLASAIAGATGIDVAVLTFEASPFDVSAAQRMSWAAKRKTARVEDRAYSLLGIFGVHMSTIYGEGEAAFRRLQEEIMKMTPGYTLFAWKPRIGQPLSNFGLLATSPEVFAENRITRMSVSDLPIAAKCFVSAIKVSSHGVCPFACHKLSN